MKRSKSKILIAVLLILVVCVLALTACDPKKQTVPTDSDNGGAGNGGNGGGGNDGSGGQQTVAVQNVSLDKAELSLEIDSEWTLTATVSPSDATDKTISWTVAPEGVVSVQNGKVTAIAEGTATVTATSNGKTAECAVTVTPAKFSYLPYQEGEEILGYIISATAALTDAEVTIPEEHNGKPVVDIYNFRNLSALESITIPASIENIYDDAFRNCPALKAAYYTGNIAAWCKVSGINNLYDTWDIGYDSDVFTVYVDGLNLRTATSIPFPAGLTAIGDYAFFKCEALTELVIPDGVQTIGLAAFQNCENLTKVVISDSVTTIDSFAFACDYAKEKTFILGKGLTEIKSGAFYMHVGTKFCFTGTESEWRQITINSVNNDVRNYYYYSETQPDVTYKYWHYDTDGVTPVIWILEEEE